MIKLRFSSHRGIFNWACQIAQYGFWATHVDIVIPGGSLLGAVSDGVRVRSPDYDAGLLKQTMAVEVRATPEQEDIFYAFVESQVGKPYDLWAILAYFWPSRDWQEFDAWVCSELAGTGLAECGILPKQMAVKFSRITVRDLFLLVSTRGRVDAG